MWQSESARPEHGVEGLPGWRQPFQQAKHLLLAESLFYGTASPIATSGEAIHLTAATVTTAATLSGHENRIEYRRHRAKPVGDGRQNDMICWSCGKKIPDEAEFCPHCEAEVEEEPTPEERAAVADLLKGMDPEALRQMREAFDQSATGEEFVTRIMVGDCPRCGGSKTGDCDTDPDINDPCVGRCFECGQLWCLDCGELFTAGQPIEHDCPFWEELGGDSLEL